MSHSYQNAIHIPKGLWICVICLGLLGSMRIGLAETKADNDKFEAPAKKITVKPVLKSKAQRVKLTPVHKASQQTTHTAKQILASTPEGASKSKKAPVMAIVPKIKAEPEKQVAAQTAPMAEKQKTVEKPALEVKPSPKKTAPPEPLMASETKPTAQKKAEKQPEPPQIKPAPTPPEKEVAQKQVKPAATPSITPKAKETVVARNQEKIKKQRQLAEKRKTIETASLAPEATPATTAPASPMPAPKERKPPAPVKEALKQAQAPAKAKAEALKPEPAPEPSQKTLAASEAAIKAVLAAPLNPGTREQLNMFAKANPASALAPEAYVRVGEISQAQNKPQAAEEAYEAAIMIANDVKSRQQAQVKLASAAAQGGNFKAAAQGWAVLRKDAPELAHDPQALNAQALAMAVENDYHGAEGLWGQLEKMPASEKPASGTISPGAKATALFGQALAAELQGRRKQAREQLERIIRNFASAPEAALARKRLADLDKPLVQ